MANILKISRIGHPVLREIAKEVDPELIGTPDFQRFLVEMVETMREYNGVGLAAPQVHVPLQVAVLEVKTYNERYGKTEEIVPLTFMINPQLAGTSGGQVLDWEGCLSVPGLRGEVPRWERITVKYLDREGSPQTLEAEGFHARVIQHEWDHLQGMVYLDRMKDMRSLSFNEEFSRYQL
ncbi:MAG: peptide deformylase [Candidatus Omnitrophica bacterium]|nr:peptide deformylase [Candidatus Omnitrophota bacterium]